MERSDSPPYSHVLNGRILRRLQRALAANPATDLLSVFPPSYTERLNRLKIQEASQGLEHCSTLTEIVSEGSNDAKVNVMGATTEQKPTINPRNHELSSAIGTTTTVVFPLSELVQDLLGAQSQDTSSAVQMECLSVSLRNIIESNQVIWQSEVCSTKAVVKCSGKTVVKIVPNIADYTEYTTLQYLAQHAPEIPAPRPLGLVVSNDVSYIFMSFVPGLTVDKIWPKLSREQKIFISNQLNEALLKLRQVNVPDNVSLGGVCGEGCKDYRCNARISQQRISTCAGFQDFQFSNPHFEGAEYTALLRGLLTSSHPGTIVFSHGDFRGANIMVEPDEHDNYHLTGIIDWEYSGFYPDSYECMKSTNNMAITETDDWYSYLPPCASPKSYPVNWLVDRIWDVHVA